MQDLDSQRVKLQVADERRLIHGPLQLDDLAVVAKNQLNGLSRQRQMLIGLLVPVKDRRNQPLFTQIVETQPFRCVLRVFLPVPFPPSRITLTSMNGV